MAHFYEVRTSDGNFNVSTDNHHDNHSDEWFRQHLIQAILDTARDVASGIILHHYTYKGRR